MAYRYKLLRGQHAEGDKDHLKVFNPGDEFISPTDITATMNIHGCPPRVQPLGEVPGVVLEGEESNAATAVQDDGLDGMKVEQLRAYADDLGVDIVGVTKKAEIIDIIRRATSPDQ